MKKIQDIKKRAPVKSIEENSIFDSFWHGHNHTVKHHRRRRVIITGKRLLAVATLISILMLATGRAYVVKADLADSAEQAKRHLNIALELLSQGKYDQAFDESNVAKKEVDKIKLNLQSWGQDSQYMQMIDYRSDLVDTETLLSTIEQVLTMTNSAQYLVEELSAKMGGQLITDTKNIDFKIDIASLDTYLLSTLEQIKDIKQSLAKRQPASNVISAGDLDKINQAFDHLSSALSGIRSSTIPILSWFMGGDGEKNVMLLFQNNAEIRGSGGFIGSYAIVTVKDHAIKKLDFQTNIYKLDNAAVSFLNVPAPPEYDVLAGGKLFLRDANYAVNGPESFAKILELYKLESGVDLDGIVAMDTSLITALLKITGPITLPQYGLTVTSENFLTDVQTEIEQNYFQRDGNKQENEPKRILADMLPLVLNLTLKKFQTTNERDSVMEILKEAISAKHFMLFSRDNSVQEKIEYNNIGGKLAQGEFDYFLSHSTNIIGGKSSLNIKEDVTDLVDIGSDGSINHNITIKRQHQGSGVWPDRANVNLMRVLLPPGSELQEFKPVTGDFQPHMDKKYSQDNIYSIGEEAGRLKLSFWMNTLPGQSSEVTFSYKSAYRISLSGQKKYTLFLQKQPGTNPNNYHLKIRYPEDWLFAANYLHSDLEYDLSLDKDKMVELDFK